jgi:hypothetical protein
MTKDEALKLALEALETELCIDWTNNEEFNASAEKMHEAITAIKEALAQPEQEPFMASYEFKQYGYYKDGKGTLKLGNIPATQPPQRTWVGLTEVDILAESKHWRNPEDFKNGVYWAAGTLKEKNT